MSPLVVDALWWTGMAAVSLAAFAFWWELPRDDD